MLGLPARDLDDCGLKIVHVGLPIGILAEGAVGVVTVGRIKNADGREVLLYVSGIGGIGCVFVGTLKALMMEGCDLSEDVVFLVAAKPEVSGCVVGEEGGEGKDECDAEYFFRCG